MITDANTHVMYRKWEVPSPKAIVLFIHGLGAHSARWEFCADYLSGVNIAGYAIELKGFGETKGLKGDIASFGSYFDDINSLRAIIRNDYPDKKVFLIGESLGGLLAFLMTAQNSGSFDGLICLSPAFKSRLKFSLFDYVRMPIAYFFDSRKQFIAPFTSQMCTRDVDFQKVMDEDAREHRFATARLLVNILAGQIRCQFLKCHLKIPTLFLIAGRDVMVNSKASLNVYKNLKTKDKTVIEYPEMAHALSIDLGREQVFEDIAEWLDKRVL